MNELVDIAAAIGEPNRVRVLLALRHGELCVCQITELLALAPSTVSKHLTVLRQAGLVRSRKEGRWNHYALPEASADPLAVNAIDWVIRSLADDPRTVTDDKALAKIRRLDKEVLCRQQRNG